VKIGDITRIKANLMTILLINVAQCLKISKRNNHSGDTEGTGDETDVYL
jgi:hypothetical protein